MEAYWKNDQFFNLFTFAIWAKCQISRLEYTEIGLIGLQRFEMNYSLKHINWQAKRDATFCIRQSKGLENGICCRPLEVFCVFAIYFNSTLAP